MLPEIPPSTPADRRRGIKIAQAIRTPLEKMEMQMEPGPLEKMEMQPEPENLKQTEI